MFACPGKVNCGRKDVKLTPPRVLPWNPVGNWDPTLPRQMTNIRLMSYYAYFMSMILNLQIARPTRRGRRG
jgi:hypothetical protein